MVFGCLYILATEINTDDMQIHFKTSLCRKCPHDVLDICDYKKAIKEALSGMLPGMHFSHRCSLYHLLFKPGQVVTLDLYNHVRDGLDDWRWELAHKNVLGTIVGTHFEFYVVELLEMVFLHRRCENNPDVAVVKPFFTYKKAAKGIHLLTDVSKFSDERLLYAGTRDGLNWN